MKRTTWRTYATQTNAIRRAAALKAQHPDREFTVVLSPDGSFRYAVATDNGRGGNAYAA